MIYVDTNILIYLLEGHQQYGKFIAESLDELTAQGDSLISSVITITEFLAGNAVSSLKTLEQVPRLRFVNLDMALAKYAATLQRKHPALHIGDAVHLATAIQQQANLLFTNDKILAKTAAGYLKVKSL
jgi:predicted nucleic acid-binding protein